MIGSGNDCRGFRDDVTSIVVPRLHTRAHPQTGRLRHKAAQFQGEQPRDRTPFRETSHVLVIEVETYQAVVKQRQRYQLCFDGRQLQAGCAWIRLDSMIVFFLSEKIEHNNQQKSTNRIIIVFLLQHSLLADNQSLFRY